jgi:hypothetical protein
MSIDLECFFNPHHVSLTFRVAPMADWLVSIDVDAPGVDVRTSLSHASTGALLAYFDRAFNRNKDAKHHAEAIVLIEEMRAYLSSEVPATNTVCEFLRRAEKVLGAEVKAAEQPLPEAGRKVGP